MKTFVKIPTPKVHNVRQYQRHSNQDGMIRIVRMEQLLDREFRKWNIRKIISYDEEDNFCNINKTRQAFPSMNETKLLFNAV